MARLQVILHQGPFDGALFGIEKVNEDWPLKIRVASGDEDDDPLPASDYRRHDVDESGTIFMGSYVHYDDVLSKRSLIDYWE